MANIVERAYRGIGSGWLALKELTLDPETFFEDRVGSGGLRKELLALLVIGLVGLPGWIYMVTQIFEEFTVNSLVPSPEETVLTTRTQYQLWGSTIQESLVEIVAVWLAYVIVIYLLTWLLTEQGSLFALAKNLAWGLYPILFAYAIQSIGLAISFWRLDDWERELPGFAQANVPYLIEQGLEDPVMIVATIAMIPFILWTGYLMTIAVEKVRGLPRSTAMRVVAIPVAGHILHTLSDILTVHGVI